MKNTVLSFVYLLVLLSNQACHQSNSEKEGMNNSSEIEFDKTKWGIKTGPDYPYRDQMLKDLLVKGIIKKIKRDSILNLLGEPNRIDSGYIFYTIAQQRIGFFPLHTKTLVIKTANDSTVIWTKIHE